MNKYSGRYNYYDKEGNQITYDKWAQMISDFSYRIIDYYEIGTYRISTVWMGLNHNIHGDPIHIFETMIFREDGDETDELHLYQERYSTLTEAVNGHDRAVKMAMEAVNRMDPVHREVEDRMD